MNLEEQLEAVCGPAARHSEYSVGDWITYRVGNGATRRGEILFVSEEQQVISTHVPLTYVCDSDHGFPDLVYSGDIIERLTT